MGEGWLRSSYTCHSLVTVSNTIVLILIYACLNYVDMHNAFNECNQSVFLERVKACLPELFGWTQWCYVFPVELRFGKRRILSLAGV